jgi:hypothetical protein
MPRVPPRVASGWWSSARCAATPTVQDLEERDGDREIRVGDRYYTWARKTDEADGLLPSRRVRDAKARLSSRKAIRIEEAISELTCRAGRPRSTRTAASPLATGASHDAGVGR